MGDGEGNRDVSDRIEDEEQILGLQEPMKDKKEPNDNQNAEKEEDTGKEMENEFEGDMFDIKEKEPDENEENQENEVKEDHDREMGDAKDDAEVIDEKLWDENEDDNKNDKEEKIEKDSQVKNGQNDEVAAKPETNEESKDDTGNKPEPVENNLSDESKDESLEEMKDDEDINGMGEDPSKVNDNENNIEENHKVDVEIPEDLNLDENEIDESVEENLPEKEEPALEKDDMTDLNDFPEDNPDKKLDEESKIENEENMDANDAEDQEDGTTEDAKVENMEVENNDNISNDENVIMPSPEPQEARANENSMDQSIPSETGAPSNSNEQQGAETQVLNFRLIDFYFRACLVQIPFQLRMLNQIINQSAVLLRKKLNPN